MAPSQKTARVAGLLYLLVVASGFFHLLYVPSRLLVPGNAAATVGHLLAGETLFGWVFSGAWYATPPFWSYQWRSIGCWPRFSQRGRC